MIMSNSIIGFGTQSANGLLLYIAYYFRVTSTFIPARNCFKSLGLLLLVNSIRTGMRCCTFTKLPVELSTGTAAYLAPVAPDTAMIFPSKARPPRASTLIVAG